MQRAGSGTCWFCVTLTESLTEANRDETMYSRSVSGGSFHHGGENTALEGCGKGCLHQSRPLLKEEAGRAWSLKYP